MNWKSQAKQVIWKFSDNSVFTWRLSTVNLASSVYSQNEESEIFFSQ